MQSMQPVPQEVKWSQYIIYVEIILSIIGAVLTLIFVNSMKLPATATATPGVDPAQILAIAKTSAIAGAVIGAIVYIVLGLLFSWKLGQLRSWARIVIIVLAIIGLVLAVIGLVYSLANPASAAMLPASERIYSYIANVIVIILDALLLYFLFRPNVKEAFRAQRSTPVMP